jgi:hypothetical protein
MGGSLAAPIEACLFGADNMPVYMSLSAQVMVVSFEQVPGPNCNELPPSTSTAPSWRLIVEDASAQRWTIFLRLPDLPADVVVAGDALDLKLTGSRGGFPNGPTQQIVLKRGGALVMFGMMGTYLPWTVTDDVALIPGGGCSGPTGQCSYTSYLAKVTVRDSVALVGPQQTKVIGNVAVTVDRLSSFNPGGGGCDGSSHAHVGGYALPSANP